MMNTEIVTAVESLYADELRPYGRILRKRLAERGFQQAVDMEASCLRKLCDACPGVYTQEEQGGEWSALLTGRPMPFVDAYSPEDIYPADLWCAAAAYFASVEGSDMALPGGRYSCAQVLMARHLPFLEGRSLGEVSHIVQLAISQKKLLGYLNGDVVPYGRSQSMLKDQCAKRQSPCTSALGSSRSYATWNMVRTFLREALTNLDSRASSLPLSNIKRLFRARFHVELSETFLGYAKLSELLQDIRLQDICTVRLQGNSYAVFPLATGREKRSISIADSLNHGASGDTTVPSTNHIASFAHPLGCIAMGAGHTSFIAQANTVQVAGVYNDYVLTQMPSILDSVVVPSGVGTVTPGLREHMPRVAPLELDEIERGSELEAFTIPQTPSPSSLRGVYGVRHLPMLLGSVGPAHAAAQTTTACTGPCVCKVLPDPPVSSPVALPDTKAPPAPVGFSNLSVPPLVTPSTRSLLSVHNTFFHLKVPVQSPSALGSRRRSLSQ